jgi:hypothetical protein
MQGASQFSGKFVGLRPIGAAEYGGDATAVEQCEQSGTIRVVAVSRHGVQRAEQGRHARGWAVEHLPGLHLHQLVDPDAVAERIVAMTRSWAILKISWYLSEGQRRGPVCVALSWARGTARHGPTSSPAGRAQVRHSPQASPYVA